MSEERNEVTEVKGADEQRAMIRQVIEEFMKLQRESTEPAYKAELLEERQKREALERRLNELAEENRRQRELREEAERSAAIRAELQRLGVAKVDLAFRAVKDDIYRSEDGRLVARGEQGEVGLREYLWRFVQENPELLPARIGGGSGTTEAPRGMVTSSSTIELEKIRPGMSREEAERAREEIVKIASQLLGSR
ncbi:MAG: hypothetical protein ACPL88_00815 [Bryobacteraceae bacterium]